MTALIPEVRHVRFPEAEARAAHDPARPRVIAGRALVYGALSQVLRTPDGGAFRERFLPGAFARSLAGGADVRALIDHQPRLILGRTGAGTLRLRDGADHLGFELDAPATSYADDLLVSMGRGDLDGMSFRFYCNRDSWEEGEGHIPVRSVHEADIDEISVVTYPAYLDAGAHLRSLEAAARSLARFRRGPCLNRERRRLRLAESD